MLMATENRDVRRYFDWTIESGDSGSGSIHTQGCMVGSILTPDDLDVTTVAILVTCCETASGTYVPLVDENDIPVTVTVTATSAAKWRMLPDLSGLVVPRYWKLVCLSDPADTTSVVAQTADRVGKLCARPFA